VAETGETRGRIVRVLSLLLIFGSKVLPRAASVLFLGGEGRFLARHNEYGLAVRASALNIMMMFLMKHKTALRGRYENHLRPLANRHEVILISSGYISWDGDI
jgi:hypothetical protein